MRQTAVLRCFAISAAAILAPTPANSDSAADKCQSDAMIVFDASGSMGATEYAVKLPRIARVKNAMQTVIPEVAPLRRLGLIVYGEGTYNDCDSIELRLRPTPTAADTLLNAIKKINPRGRPVVHNV